MATEKETTKSPEPKTAPVKADETALPQPPAPPVHTSTDSDGTERIVTIADPGWEPAPSEEVYPTFDQDLDAKKDK